MCGQAWITKLRQTDAQKNERTAKNKVTYRDQPLRGDLKTATPLVSSYPINNHILPYYHLI